MGSMVICLLVTVLVFTSLRFVISSTTEQATEEVSSTYAEDMSATLLAAFRTSMSLRMDEVRSLPVSVNGNASDRTKLVFTARKYGFSQLALVTQTDCEMLYGNQISPVDSELFYNEVSTGHEILSLGTDVDGNLVILFTTPVDDVRVKGVVATLPIEYLDEVLSVGNCELLDYAVVLDTGRAVYNTAGRLEQGMLDRMRQGESFSVKTEVLGEQKYVRYVKLPVARWYLAVIVDQAYFNGLSDQIARKDIVAFIAGLTLLLVTLAGMFVVYFKIFQQQHSEVVKASKSKTEFLMNMSHDIRTPMNGIVGMTALAMSNIDDKAKLHRYLDSITTSSQYMLGLVDNMLDISGIESGRLQVHVRDFWLFEVIDQVRKTMSYSVTEKKHNFRIISKGIKYERLKGDDQKVRQILMNLISNAVKFTAPGGDITLGVKQENEWLILTVTDNGQGISSGALPRIYDAFYREDSERTTDVNGVGLGLSLVQKMVDLLEGSISVQSTKGIGSTFTVRLPLVEGFYCYEGAELIFTDDSFVKEKLRSVGVSCVDRIDDSTVVLSHEAFNVRGKKFVNLDSLSIVSAWAVLKSIESVEYVKAEEFELEDAHVLIAEDNELNYEIIHDILEEFGVKVDWAENGEECVRKFSESEIGYYSRIVMDIRMPVMNGYEASRAIRNLDRPDAKTIPIIAMSADAYAAAVEECMKSGMNAYTSKPVNIEEIIKLLQKGGY